VPVTVAGVRALLGAISPRPLLLAHHYQRDSVADAADHRGDSLELARHAAREGAGRPIVLCGVHFMAETADILTPPTTPVYLPDRTAGCPLAGMATLARVTRAWEALADAGLLRVVPVTYINSSAALKAFCGERGGTVCTSGNAAGVMRWALSRGETVLFFPDRHLGENTALAAGIEEGRIVTWDPDETGGGYRERLRRARVVLWPGFCPVHRLITPADVARARRRLPGCRVVVHPECTRQVVGAADLAGSTSMMVREIASSPPGSRWAVGTEVTLVRRLAREAGAQGKTVIPLRADAGCPNMARTTLAKLIALLASLRAGRPAAPPVRVDPAVAGPARKALDLMLEIV